MESDRRKLLLSVGGFGVLMAMTVGMALWSYYARPPGSKARKKGARDVEVRVESASFQVWAHDERDERLIAEVKAKVVQMSKDRSLIQAKEIDPVVLYRDGKVFMEGRAAAAQYDQGTSSKELTLFGGVVLKEKQGGFTMRAEELHHIGRDNRVFSDQPVTFEFPDATMRTPMIALYVEDNRLECIRQVVLTTRRGATLSARSAQLDVASYVLKMAGNVVANVTVGEAQELAGKRSKAPAASAKTPSKTSNPDSALDKMTRFRLKTHHFEYSLKDGTGSCPSPIIIRTADGSARADQAQITQDLVVLQGNVRALMTMGDEPGRTDIATDVIQYRPGVDEFLAPGQVTVTTAASVFQCGSAKARPSEGRIWMTGGVRGAIDR
ncbi:MAG TPA: LPS export ABC transporter periplasmic protein LptC, partial [Armatimonadota bacterium]|nr:LPS export ABC transporter periplasmic protein LptC [Armatimonadota bacterium]